MKKKTKGGGTGSSLPPAWGSGGLKKPGVNWVKINKINVKEIEIVSYL